MARNTEPAVQASYMKNLLDGLRSRGALERVAAADPDLLPEIEDAPRTRWLPVALNLRLVEAVARAFGEERGLALLADCVEAQFDTPLWRTLVTGALRLFGTDPGRLGRVIPHSLALIFRSCGEWAVQNDEGPNLAVTARRLPDSLATHSLWLRSICVGMTPLFRLCEVQGTSKLEEVDEAGRTARYRLTWTPRD